MHRFLLLLSLVILAPQIVYSQNYVDTDQDQIPDELDKCPSEAETFNGIDDQDGCPESQYVDSDQDQIEDANDLCPLEAETFNGIDDQDGCPDESSQPSVMLETPSVPTWVKNNAKWWADGQIPENDFLNGIEFLINQNIIVIKKSESSANQDSKVPEWIKNNAKWWADDKISEGDFLSGIEYLVSNDIIKIGSSDELKGKWVAIAKLGTDLGSVKYPKGMAIDSENNLYVLDVGNNRVQKYDGVQWSKVPKSVGANQIDIEFDSKGRFNTQGPGSIAYYKYDDYNLVKECYRESVGGVVGSIDYFCSMSSFTFDSSDAIFYTEYSTDMVFKYSFKVPVKICDGGKYEVDCTEPSGITVDANDNVYVSAASGILKFDSKSLKWTSIAKSGSDLGEVNNPEGIDVKNGKLYVMDAANERVQILDLKSNAWKFIKYPNMRTESFDRCPIHLDVDSKGTIYVSESCYDKIMMWK